MLINIQDLFITYRIADAIKSFNPDFDPSNFVLLEDNTLELSRMENMMNDKLYNTTEREPIKISKNGFIGMHDIIDGRHRVARAILLGKDKIECELV